MPKLYSSTEHDETSPGLAEDPSTSPDQIWKKIGGVSLNQKNRSALLKPGSWLNDLIVDACQFLLKKKFPHYGGFQNPLLGSVLHFKKECSKLIQILHDGSQHWLTVAYTPTEKEPEVDIYDSVYVTINKHVKEQIATLLSTKYQIIKTHIMDVQKQVGSSDCGLFAIANATALAYAIRPDTCWYDQGKMHQHLYECLQQEDLTPFPLRRERRSKEIKFSDNIKVFCICQMPQTGLMVMCSKCHNWFHVGCVTPPQEVIKNTHIKWFCHDCF